MKSKKYLSWLLCLSLLCTMLALPSAPVYAEESGKDSGIVLKKTATYNEADESYTIRLEAYATGSKIVSTVTEDVPTDIVLVLDQSGSMADCIVCGKSDSSTHKADAYEEADTIDNGSRYYIKEGSAYTQVQYCSGSHQILFWSEPCEGGAGWYTSSDRSEHTSDNKITPKDSDHTDGTQFYTRTQRSEKCIKRMDALKSAATGFVNAVAKKAAGKDENVNTIDDNVNHRIAVVSYADNASNQTSGFKNMDAAGVADTVNRVINGLDASGGTYIDDGISTANGIFASNPLEADEKRNRVMIVFTDGAPGYNGDWCTGGWGSHNPTCTSTANDAIAYAYTAKNTHGATVYTIGIFEGANASNPSSLPSNNNYTNKTNRFMHLVSSNYKEARSMTEPGSVNSDLKGGSYYLSAGDSDALNNIFEKISDQIETGSTSVTLDEKSVIKDIVTPYFDIPNGATGVTLKTADYTAENTFTNEADAPATVKAEIKDNTLSVSGFSFKDNWCGEENGKYHGKKLIIEFTVKPKAGFLGGNGVPTNESAGIYENAAAEKPVVSAEVDPVDVPIGKVEITHADANVYLGASYSTTVSSKEIKGEMKLTIGGVEINLDPTVENFGLDEWQNKFVDIKVEVKDENGNTVENFEMLEDKKYSVTVTVTPKSNDAAGNKTPVSGNSKGTIHVFTPELTFKDSKVSYMASIDNYNYAKNDYVEIKWRHQDAGDETPKYSTAPEVTMLGKAPNLTYEYAPTAGVDSNNIVIAMNYVPVQVTVKIGETPVTSHTTFVHQACTDAACQWNTAKDAADPSNPAFLLHVINVVGDLTITKKGLNVGTYTGTEDQESAIFKVTGNGVDMTVVVNCEENSSTGSVTIANLPAGTYTVEEVSGWTWRYTVEGDASKTATVVGGSLDNKVEFTNTQTNDKWLGGDNYKNNVFGN